MNALEEQIRNAPAGSVVQVPEGEHRLSRPLVIDKPLRLEGNWCENTRVVCASPWFVVRVAGDVRFRAQRITFVHEGEYPGNVIEVEDSFVELYECVFEGGKTDNNRNIRYMAGCGILLYGTARGKIVHCVVQNNENHGIYVTENAQPTLDFNICRQNKGNGITYLDNTGGTAYENTCEYNESCGIYVGKKARPTLESNSCRKNKCSGIIYHDSAYGTVRNNRCEENEDSGIVVFGDAFPTIEYNFCRKNERNGIYYSGSSAGTIRRNIVWGNKRCAIDLYPYSYPLMENNVCRNK